MAGPYKFSPSAGSKLAIQINSNYVVIAGCEGIPEFGAEKGTYEVTAINDVAKSFGDDLPDYGELSLTGSADTTDTKPKGWRGVPVPNPGRDGGLLARTPREPRPRPVHRR